MSLTQSCDPTSIATGESSTCAVTVTNNTFSDADVAPHHVGRPPPADHRRRRRHRRRQHGVAGHGRRWRRRSTATPHACAGRLAGGRRVPAPGRVRRARRPPSATRRSSTTTCPRSCTTAPRTPAIGVTSDGYLVAGGGEAADVEFVPQTLPDPTRPNNVLAPFWTDLNGEHGAQRRRRRHPRRACSPTAPTTGSWSSGTSPSSERPPTSAASRRGSGVNGTEDISYVWNETLAPAPAANGLTIGAENSGGLGGFTLHDAARRLERLRRPAGGEHAVHAGREPHLRRDGARARSTGTGQVTTRMTAPDVPGTYVVRTDVER